MIFKKANDRKDWEQKYKLALKFYGHAQFLIDLPAIRGKTSFSYSKDSKNTICIYYE